MGRTMQITQSFQKLSGPPDYLGLRKFFSVPQRFIKTFSFHIINHRINGIAFNKEIIHLRYISMAQLFQHIHFTAQQFLFCGDLSFVCLQNHLFSQTEMPGQKNSTSAAGAYFPNNFIT